MTNIIVVILMNSVIIFFFFRIHEPKPYSRFRSREKRMIPTPSEPAYSASVLMIGRACLFQLKALGIFVVAF